MLVGAYSPRLIAFLARDDIAAGRLQPVLDACNPADMEEVHAIYPGQRALLDFLAVKAGIG